MLKAVFRPSELVALTDKIVIDSPTSFSDLATIEEIKEDVIDIDEYKGPTADDLRREAEYFKASWEEEKERMFESARAESERIIQDAQNAAFTEVKRQSDEAQIIKQQAIEDAERIVADSHTKAREIENEIRQSIESERKTAYEKGKEEGREIGFSEGKAEVDRLITRTQIVLERAQDKRGEILNETEQQIIDLVLLIARKVIKVISENQRSVIIDNVIEALRKVKSKGDIIIRVNLVDLQLATEHKQDFIRLVENAKSIQIIEDSTVDLGGCIIETDFGQIDARIISQLAELENKILEVSPIKSITNETPVPVVNDVNVKQVLSATSTMLNLNRKKPEQEKILDNDFSKDDDDLSQGINVALTASAALAGLATMAQKGKRDADKKIAEKLENLSNVTKKMD
jgi:flagellar assembly protein FliH